MAGKTLAKKPKTEELVARIENDSSSWAGAKAAAELAIRMMESREQEIKTAKLVNELAAQMVEAQNQKKRQAYEWYGGLWIARPANSLN